MAVTYDWQIKAADAASAYLQSDGIKRLLILRPPWPLPDPSLRGYLLRAKGTIYGTKDAGRGWWLKLCRILMLVGWKKHPLEPACFMMHDGKELIGFLMVHVDDLLYCGDGKKVIQDKDGIKVTQHDVAMAIQYAEIEP